MFLCRKKMKPPRSSAMSCEFIITKGGRKGMVCGRPVRSRAEGYATCAIHTMCGCTRTRGRQRRNCPTCKNRAKFANACIKMHAAMAQMCAEIDAEGGPVAAVSATKDLLLGVSVLNAVTGAALGALNGTFPQQ